MKIYDNPNYHPSDELAASVKKVVIALVIIVFLSVSLGCAITYYALKKIHCNVPVQNK